MLLTVLRRPLRCGDLRPPSLLDHLRKARASRTVESIESMSKGFSIVSQPILRSMSALSRRYCTSPEHTITGTANEDGAAMYVPHVGGSLLDKQAPNSPIA